MDKLRGFLNNHKRKEGFTLVELLVVIVVIGILFVAFISRIDFATDKARETGVKSDFRSYQTAFEQVFREEAGYKVTEEAGKTLKDKLNTCLDGKLALASSDATTGTVVDLAVDAWGTKYEIKHGKLTGGGNNDGYVVIKSLGPNATSEAEAFDSATGVVTPAEGSDDYFLVTTWKKGELKTNTYGFSQNIQ